jgi:LCP family protein required for cell wall assembly
MSNRANKNGKREDNSRLSAFAQYKAWVAGLTKGQRIRYRVLQGATVAAILVIVAFFGLRSWVKVPELPDFGAHGSEDGTGDGFEGAEIPDIAKSGRKEGVYTFLVVGKDTAGGGNTDTMLLLTYDTEAKTIHGLNLPRDTMVNVSTTGKRLNAVYNYNKGKDKATQVEKGMAALKQQVAYLTGITPDYYVIVEWEAVGKLVDALGGVEFDVPFDMNYDDPTPGQDLHIHQQAGLRLLDGDDAMQVIRFRKNNDGTHSNGDVGRLKIQQDFLKAVAKKCLQPATFLKLPELAKIFSENVTTDLTLGNILAFAQLANGMDAEEGVSFETAPIGASFNYKGAAMITLDADKLLEILNDGMNPYLRNIQSSDLQLLYRNSDGTFSVTSGTLADPKMGQSQSTTSSGSSQSSSGSTTGSSTTGGSTTSGSGSNHSTSGSGSSGTTGTQETPSTSGSTSSPSETTPDEEVANGQIGAETPDHGDNNAQTGTTPDHSGTTQGSSGGSASGGTVEEPAHQEPSTGSDANVSQDAGAADDSVAVLPSWPQPLEPVA